MRLRRACTLIALCAALLASGCCFDHCWRRHRMHERDCDCPCPCAAPSTCGCESSSYAPPVAPPAPLIPPPVPLMPGGAH